MKPMRIQIKLLTKENMDHTESHPKQITTRLKQPSLAPSGPLLIYRAHAIKDSLASELYRRLLDMSPWLQSNEIRSRRTGFTRKARKVGVDDPLFIELVPYVESVLKLLDRSYTILGLYLNWYENEQSYTPSHRHETDQLVIFLGATRILRVGSRDFSMEHGDAVLFGKQLHSVPRGNSLPASPRFPQGRISIATFMVPFCLHDAVKSNVIYFER